MTSTDHQIPMNGQCLCGAVTISVVPLAQEISICHCDMCRRWAGLAMGVFQARADQFHVTGPVRRFRSSSFAERAFCEVCGSALWVRDDGADYDMVPGLFDAAADFPLVREVFADRAYACLRLAGKHKRVSRDEYVLSQPFVEEA